MAATVKTRIQLKYDTENNWNKAINFIPLKGEIIIYSIDDSHPFCRLKVGDGETSIINLPFIIANSSETLIKIGTTAELNSDISYIPPKGEIRLYLDKTTIVDNNKTITVPGIKVGDGLAYGVDLPFLGDDILKKLLDHIADEAAHITQEERAFWNNKINCEDEVSNEILILNRN